MLTSLSGRFLILTVIFVLLAEMLIFVPSIARFRADWLSERMERAQIASLTLLSAPEMIDMGLEQELLDNAGVLNVVLRRDELRQLILSSDLPGPVARTVDLRDPTAATLITDALRRYVMPEPEIVRVIAQPAMGGGLQIEAAIDTKPLRAAMIDYGINILALSAVISAITAAFLFLAVRRLMVMPIRGLVRHMNAFAAAPEDARRVIEPRSSVRELREAETTLRDLETQLQQNLRQKERLAQLGGAVAKIAHDLRNILTTATLLGDRLESIDDPTVRRVGPKIVKSLARAVSLTEGTLAFGRAEEAPPRLQQIALRELLEEVAEAERLAVPDGAVAIEVEADPAVTIRADPDQMLRVLGNLTRNARQAIQATGQGSRVTLRGTDRPDAWCLEVSDDGPGLPAQAREGLFEAFKGSVRKGGTGLGLAIAAELVRGHGGTLDLAGSDDGGTTFRIELPKGEVA